MTFDDPALPGLQGKRWLTAAEKRAWLGLCGSMRLIDEAIDDDLHIGDALSHSDYQILAMLSAAPEHRLRMSTLAEVVFVSRSRLTYQVTQLEQRGLVRREDFPSDRRGQVAVLTGAGLAVLQAAAPGHVASVRRVFFDLLTEEQVAVLGDAFSAIIARALKDRERELLAALWAGQ